MFFNNQNIFVSKLHCQDCLSDNRSLDLPKTARQVSLSDDQIQLFFLPSTVYIRLGLINLALETSRGCHRKCRRSRVSGFLLGALGRSRPPLASSSCHGSPPSLWPNKMPSLAYQMLEIYVFFPPVLYSTY